MDSALEDSEPSLLTRVKLKYENLAKEASPDIDRLQTTFKANTVKLVKVQFAPPQINGSCQNKSSKSLTYSEPIQFAVNKTVKGFTERKVKAEYRPSKKQRLSKYPRNDDVLILTGRKPVSAFVPIDAWAQIFRRSDLKFLLQAQLVCKDFRDILTAQSIWRDARLYNHGDSIPSCPPGLNEKQYINLLVGRGCQIKPCTQKLTKKVYWAFMLRMCESCFKNTTQKLDDDCEESRIYGELFSQLEHEIKSSIPPRLFELLPSSNVLGVGGAYAQTRQLDRNNQMWRYPDEVRLYCAKTEDFEVLKRDFQRTVVAEPAQFLRWVNQRWKETKERVRLARDLDIACRDLLDRARTRREEKQDFYTEQALNLLDPPMTMEVLEKMTAYHRALDTPNAASQRAWDTLAAKIDSPELRVQAETLIQWDREFLSSGWTTDEDGLEDRIALHRGESVSFMSDRPDYEVKSPEQEVVLEIAREALEEILDVVHDEDLLLMLLQNVRRNYERMAHKPQGLNIDGERAEYRLMLDDARMVIEKVLKPQILARGIVRSKQVLSSLRCIGCTRADCQKTYNFTGLLIHIRLTHACYVGKNMHFWKLAIPRKSRIKRYTDKVAWYQLLWPKSFPALPYHRKATSGMVWDPDTEEGYLQHEQAVRFFEQLQVVRDSGNRTQNIMNDLVTAVKTLLPTKLDPDGIIRIALEYACRRQTDQAQEGSMDLRVSIAQLEEWESLLKAFTPKFTLKFKCGLCLIDPRCGNRGKQKRETLYLQPLSNLITHWHRKHRIEDDALESDLIMLPSDLTLQKTVMAEDIKLRTEHKRILSKQQMGQGDARPRDKQEKITPRENAMLKLPTIQSRLRLLFLPKDTHDSNLVSVPGVQAMHVS